MDEPIAQKGRRELADDEINLLDLLIVLLKHKWFIVKFVFLSVLLSMAYAMSLPKIYTAKAVIMPPQQAQSSASAMLGQLGALAGGAGAALGIKNPSDTYIGMLKSRILQDRLVDRFKLKEYYETEYYESARKNLESDSAITLGKDGFITIELSNKDQKKAAEIANAYFEELNKLTQNFALTEAAQRRTFFEAQMRAAKDKLTDVELVLDRTPNTSLHYMDAVRNLKYQEGIYEILAKQYAMAKLDEAKDSPLIQVLDKALPPEKKSKPKRAMIVMLSVLVGFFISILWVFIREAREKARLNPENAERLEAFRRYGFVKNAIR